MFTPDPLVTDPASDLVQRNLAFARRLSLRTPKIVSLFHCRLGKHDIGVAILFNARSQRRHSDYGRLTELASFKCGELLPAHGGVVDAAAVA